MKSGITWRKTAKLFAALIASLCITAVIRKITYLSDRNLKIDLPFPGIAEVTLLEESKYYNLSILACAFIACGLFLVISSVLLSGKTTKLSWGFYVGIVLTVLPRIFEPQIPAFAKYTGTSVYTTEINTQTAFAELDHQDLFKIVKWVSRNKYKMKGPSSEGVQNIICMVLPDCR